MMRRRRTERTAGEGTGGDTVNRAERRVLLVGAVGAALLLGAVIGLAMERGGPVATVSDGPTRVVLVDAVTADPYLLTPPNEHDLGSTASGLPASGATASPATALPYRLSPPNEHDPGW